MCGESQNHKTRNIFVDGMLRITLGVCDLCIMILLSSHGCCDLHNNTPKLMWLQQAAVTDVQPVTNGFLTCGGDGIVKLFKHQY